MLFMLSLIAARGEAPLSAPLRGETLRYADSLARAGYTLYLGDSTVKANPDSAIRLLAEAAELGHPKAANNLAFIYLHRDSLRPDTLAALPLLERAARAGLPTAMSQLADICAARRDTLSADSLYLLAASRGLRDADVRLTAMLAPKWQALSADSLLSLGRKYYGAGAPFAAVNALSMAIRGYEDLEEDVLADSVPPEATALAILGDAFATGRGVSYDYMASLRSFYRAALLGDPSAQFILGETLDLTPDALDALGVDSQSPDADSARWYLLAARKGVTDARIARRRLF